MFLTFLFFLLGYTDQGYKYQNSFRKSAEAYYESTDIKAGLNKLEVKIRKEQPAVAFTSGIAYSALYKREIRLKSTKIIPFNNTELNVFANQQTATVAVSWRF